MSDCTTSHWHYTWGVTMPERKRARVLNVRLAEEETTMLAALAEQDGLSVSDWVRRAIRTSFRRAFPIVQPPTKTRRTPK